MNAPTTVVSCRRTPAIIEASLDGAVSARDRTHLAGCAACRAAASHVVGFEHRLATVATQVSDGIPDPIGIQRKRRKGLSVAPAATLGAAVAVGLAIAAMVGIRAEQPVGRPPSPFGSVAAASEALAPLGLTCSEVAAGAVCDATASDHVHQVTLTAQDGRIVEVEARIDSTVDAPLVLDGVDYFMAQIADAVMTPEAASATGSWLRDAYAGCGSDCGAELQTVAVSLTRDSQSISLILRGR